MSDVVPEGSPGWVGRPGWAKLRLGVFELQAGRNFNRKRSYFYRIALVCGGSPLGERYGFPSARKARREAVKALQAILTQAQQEAARVQAA